MFHVYITYCIYFYFREFDLFTAQQWILNFHPYKFQKHHTIHQITGMVECHHNLIFCLICCLPNGFQELSYDFTNYKLISIKLPCSSRCFHFLEKRKTNVDMTAKIVYIFNIRIEYLRQISFPYWNLRKGILIVTLFTYTNSPRFDHFVLDWLMCWSIYHEIFLQIVSLVTTFDNAI